MNRTVMIIVGSLLFLAALVIGVLLAGFLWFASVSRPMVIPPAPATRSAELVPMPADNPPKIETPAAPKDAVVYTSDFTGEVGAEWSHTKISKTPTKRPYLGGFVEQPVTFAHTNLPKHKYVRVTFDLFLLRSWDGSSKPWGEKIFDIEVAGGPRLLHTTFGNCGFFRDNNEQAFPDTFPCRPHPAWTGASEKQTLGVKQGWGGPDRTFDVSSVYKMVLTFPHEGPGLSMTFKATMRKYKDKTWGLGNFKVETLVKGAKLNDEQLAQCWRELGDADPTVAFKAQWRLIEAGEAATTYIGAHLADPCNPTDADLAKWLDETTAEEWAIAGPAFMRLKSGGLRTANLIDSRLASDPPNTKYTWLQRELASQLKDYPESQTELRQHRAKRALEVINTATSRKMAERIPMHASGDVP